MKSILLTITAAFLSTFVQGQDIKIDIDSSFFNKKTGNVYYSDATGAKMNVILLPISYDNSLKSVQNQSNKDIRIIEKGEFKHNGGNRIYFKKGDGIRNDKNENEMMLVFLIENSTNQSIMISVLYKPEYDKLVAEQVDRIVRSIKPIY